MIKEIRFRCLIFALTANLLSLLSIAQNNEKKNHLSLSIGAHINIFRGDNYIDDSVNIFYGPFNWSSDQKFYIRNSKGLNAGIFYHRTLSERVEFTTGINLFRRSQLYNIQKDSFIYYGYDPNKNYIEYENILWYIELPILIKYSFYKGLYVEGGIKFSPQFIYQRIFTYYDNRKYIENRGLSKIREILLEASAGYDFFKMKLVGIKLGINYSGIKWWGSFDDGYNISYFFAVNWRFFNFNKSTFKRKHKGNLRNWKKPEN